MQKAGSGASLSSSNHPATNSTTSSPAFARTGSLLMMAPSAVSKAVRRASLAGLGVGGGSGGGGGGGAAESRINTVSRSASPLLVSHGSFLHHNKAHTSIRRPTRLVMSSFFPSANGGEEDPDVEMTATEAAFLPRDVRERLSQFVNGTLPPAPAIYFKQGAAMFVDISGFSALGETLKNNSEDGKQAAEELARQIICVLNELTKICLAAGGDVAKYAGDALLCTFQVGSEDECLVRAQNCALDMLMSMRRYNYSSSVGGGGGGAQLEIHGGISLGTIMHFHLGSSDDELRWYLVAGDAVASAVSLVDQALPGQILLATQTGLLSPDWAVADPVPASSSAAAAATASSSIRRTRDSSEAGGVVVMGLTARAEMAQVVADSPLFSPSHGSGERPITPSRARATHAVKSRKFFDQPSKLEFGLKLVLKTKAGDSIDLFALSADTEKVEMGFASSSSTSTGGGVASTTLPPHVMAIKGGSSVYDISLHVSGTAYIPKSLRAGLRTGFNTSEMRNKVSVVFVGLPGLALSDVELLSHTVANSKLDALNQAFVKMTRVSHSFDGEIRDLLFDDKGCIFIAVFGAFTSSEMAELKACKCAMAISHEFPQSKVGVSTGTCFVGMCGSPKRHDFIVMGHEVNIAARCMVVASEGQVLVSPEIERETRELIQYEKVPFNFNKRRHGQDGAGGEAGGFAFVINSEIARRPSFLAQYRYGLRDRDLFVGRRLELARIERTVLKVVFGEEEEEATSTSAAEEEREPSSFSRNGTSGVLKLKSAAAMAATAAATAAAADADEEEVPRGSGVLLLEAAAGMGKSAFVSRVKKFGKGRLIIASTAAFSLEQENEFFVFRHLLESFTGFRRDMSIYQLRRIANEEYGGESPLDFDVLSDVIPWMKDVMRVNGNSRQNTASSVSSTSSSFSGVRISSERMDKIGQQVIKLLSGFRGRLTLNQVLEGASGKGALLCIEDVQWMDASSLRLLKYLLAHLDQLSGLMILLTSRLNKQSEEKEQDAPTERARLVSQVLQLAKPPTNRALASEVLTGLNQEDTSELVALLLRVDQSQVAPHVLDFVFHRTQGYPMYIVSLMEWIHDRRLLVEREAGGQKRFDWVDANVDSLQFPNTLADTMLSKFDALDAQTRNLLKIATALGPEFDAIKLTTLANIDLAKTANKNTLTEERVLESLVKAEAQGVLSVVRTKNVRAGAHIWRFKHETMMLAVQSIIPAERNEQLQQLLKPMRQVVENKKLLPLFAGFLGEVDDDDDDEDKD